ncbi:MAG TPA: prepilin peptidase [Gemmatimonadaceae bacterium]|nr:prepilin peptidase [Gemmatimonadaceae bacterium]
MSEIIIGLFAFAVGACVGSFLNVCISRWPLELSVVSPPSRCPRCERPIRWNENIPVLGWLLLRGRCRGCELPISMQYPAVELAVGVGWLAVVYALGPTFTALRVAVFGTVMLGIAITDARHYLIPDGFTVFGLLWVIVTSVLAALWGDPGTFAGPWNAILGMCVGAGAIAIAGWLGEVVMRREAMGFGDVTLMAVVGAAVGPGRALLVVFLGAFLGAVTFMLFVLPITRLRGGTRNGPQLELPIGASVAVAPEVPFGVFLAPAAVVTLLWGDTLIAWYLARFATL